MRLMIRVEGRNYDVDVETLPDRALAETPEVNQVLPHFPPPKEDSMPQDPICRSPISGLIVAVLVQPGKRVCKDEPLFTIEAMKMLTSIGAPVDGVVDDLQVSAGENVRPGQVLCAVNR